MKTVVTAWIIALCILVVGCSKSSSPNESNKETPTKTEPAAKAEGDGHAPKDVVPGSHEDWCEEHQVPESQCTRCNPELIAAFKATGDWCEEHGVPESQCTKCNPDLKIVRPPKK